MRSSGSRLAGLLVTSLVLAGLARGASAWVRLTRVFDERDGLAVAEIFELAQDARGFLWIGASSGLLRFDGREFRPWAPARLRHVVRALATDTRGDVLVLASDEPLWMVHGDSVDAVRGPDGGDVLGAVHATLSPSGTTAVAWPARLALRDPGGRWRTFAPGAFDSTEIVRVIPGRGDTVLVATRGALWSVAGAGPPRRLAPVGSVRDARPWPDGGWIALTLDGRLWRLAGDSRELLFRGRSSVGLAVRGRTIWCTIDRYVIALAPGAPPDTIAPSPTCPAGRPQLVDREGSLWIGGFGGLVHMPEPDTRIWGAGDGLPNPPHAFALARAGDAIRVLTWFGARDVYPANPRRRPADRGLISGGCFADSRGRLWWADRERGFRVLESGRTRFYPRPGLHRVAAAHVRADGDTWLATDDGLFLAAAAPGPPAFVPSIPPAAWGPTWTDAWITGVVEDAHGRLWIARGEDVASADADSLARGLGANWRVAHLPGSELVTSLRLLPDGDLWAATSIAGLWRGHAGRWREEPDNASLPSLRIYDLAPARGGGWWLLADGWIGRVTPRAGSGWQVRETPSAWQGLPTLQASGLLEDPDGHLWIASLAGLLDVPASARRAEREAPRVELVEARVGGSRASPGAALVLPSRHNSLEVRFTALSFRDPSHLRYQVRLLPGGSWIETRDPVFHAVDVPAGPHEFEVRASLDGVRWSGAPAALAFRVRRPWWAEPWVIAAMLLAVGAVALAAHRLRVAMLLRLERQRLRIAMDLHDEMGSGLGSIGILAGMAAEAPLADETRRQLAGEIATLTSDVGASLADIVRALRDGPDTLDRWAWQLAERAQRLAPGPRPALRVVYPASIPSVPLAPGARREVLLAAVEALHNAVRHAGASRLALGLEPAGSRWRLWIEDDGRGLAPDAFDRPGSFGLGNMRRRVASVGGSVTWRARLGGGTRVEIDFTPGEPAARHGLARIFMRAGRGAERGRIDA